MSRKVTFIWSAFLGTEIIALAIVLPFRGFFIIQSTMEPRESASGYLRASKLFFPPKTAARRGCRASNGRGRRNLRPTGVPEVWDRRGGAGRRRWSGGRHSFHRKAGRPG